MEWEEIVSCKFYQNRIIPAQWKHLFVEKGLKLCDFIIESNADIEDAIFEEFHSDFKLFSKSDLGETDCIIAGLNEL